MQLQGQVAMVTGAAQGIGKAIALRLAREGADIAIADIDADRAQATAAAVRAVGRRTFFSTTDVSDYENVQSFVAGVIAQLGRIDILVNNAGIAKAQSFFEVTRENWEQHVRIHLCGAFYCAQAAARNMREHNYGRIISVASIAGLMGPIDSVPYGAAKAGIIGLTRAMSLELGDYGITVNAIAPGPVDTDLLRNLWQGRAKEMYADRASQIPIRRLGTVDDIAHAAAFLAAPDSSYISGIVLGVDGGAVAAGGYMVEQYRRRKADS